MLHSGVPCCVNSCGISLIHCNRRMVFLTEVIQERKLLQVIVGGFTSDHKSAAVRSQGVWFPSYGRFNVLRRTKLESLLLTKVIQESKLLTVIVGGFTNDHKSAAVRSQGVRFPSYGRFKVLKRTDLEFSRVVGCPPGIERLYNELPWLVHDYCYKMHWGKVVLPLMVKFLHWIRCKWKI